MTEDNLWRRSTFCESGACVEVRLAVGVVFVRNTQTGTVMGMKPAEFAAFVAGVKAGEFDDLAGGV